MAIVVGAEDGTDLQGRFEVVIKVRSEDTAGALAVLEETVPPRGFVTPHTHENDVSVRVLTGEVGVLVEDEVAIAAAGSWIVKPRGLVHAMWNRTDTPARIVEVLTPGGSERWFEEIAAIPAGDEDAFPAACRRHGIEFHADSPWTDRIRREFGL